MEANKQKNITFVDKVNGPFSYEVLEGETLHLEIALFKQSQDLNLEVKVHKNAKFEGSFADFSSGKLTFNLKVDLLEEGAECAWHLAALAKGKDIKSFAPSVNHLAPHTRALMSNYGIARDESNLMFLGTSEIFQGSNKSYTRQEAKIIVFDISSRGRASPILKIGDNDVDASHSASIGRLNEDHLFYLESRGVSLEEAKRLITLGYLKPIENEFKEAKIKEQIDNAIEGGI